jgi:hypothetical protein
LENLEIEIEIPDLPIVNKKRSADELDFNSIKPPSKMPALIRNLLPIKTEPQTHTTHNTPNRMPQIQ